MLQHREGVHQVLKDVARKDEIERTVVAAVEGVAVAYDVVVPEAVVERRRVDGLAVVALPFADRRRLDEADGDVRLRPDKGVDPRTDLDAGAANERLERCPRREHRARLDVDGLAASIVQLDVEGGPLAGQ